MTTRDDISWFKDQFTTQISTAIAGTPYDLDMITAVACQETGEVWQRLRLNKDMTVDRILELCVGDTLDRKSTFPTGRAQLEGAQNGPAMFTIARDALIDMAQNIPGYTAAARNPNKFCHGFGIFQYDIQFFNEVDPGYFLNRDYVKFENSLAKCIEELEAAQQRLRWQAKVSLTDLEKSAVAIAYNSGSYNASLGLKQGYFDGKTYYGEDFYAFMMLSRGVSEQQIPIALAAASVPPETGTYQIVSTKPLNLRATPDLTSNILGRYPKGTKVSVLSKNDTWALVSVSLNQSADGYMWSDYLSPVV